jgi:hypothetical protein
VTSHGCQSIFLFICVLLFLNSYNSTVYDSWINFLYDGCLEMNTLFGSSKACYSVYFVSLVYYFPDFKPFYCFAGFTMVLWSHLILVLKGTRFVFVHYNNLHWLFTLHENYFWSKDLCFSFSSWFFHFWSVGCIWWWGCRGTTSQWWKVGLYQWGMHISPHDNDYVCFLVSD